GIHNKLGKITYTQGMFLGLAGPDYCECKFSYLAASTNGTNWFQYSKTLPQPARNVATDGIRLVTVSGSFIDVSHANGFVYYSEPLVGIDITQTSPRQLVLSGLVGRSYRIESIDALTNAAPASWRTNIVLQLPSEPFLW